MSAGHPLATLFAREPLDLPSLVIVAHPDDETLALSVVLPLLTRLTLVHATISAEEDETKLRRGELAEALGRLGCHPHQSLGGGYPDGHLVDHAGSFAAMLEPLMRRSRLCITHSFEGGHPDHDACALAVAIAAERLGDDAPLLAEFPIYAVSAGRVRTTRFDGGPDNRLALSERDIAIKRDALAAFRSQSHVTERFALDVEGLRQSVRHDFLAPRSIDDVLFARGRPASIDAWRAAARHQLAR